MVDIWNERRIPRGSQFFHGKLKGLLDALICDFVILVGILGNDTLQQLIQRVFDAFAVEGGHDDALLCSNIGGVDMVS